jgi:DeoR/GlpR family transcriptional regulator of sugar metabolism
VLPEISSHKSRHVPQPSVIGLASHEAIGRAAARFVRRGSTIGVGAGPLCESLARHLAGVWPLTVLTNSLGVAKAIDDSAGHTTVILAGGVVAGRGVVTGGLASSTIATITLDTAFVGCDGLDVDAGLTCCSLGESATNANFVSGAGEVIGLAPETALGHLALCTFARLGDLNALVIGPGVSGTALEILREHVHDVVEAGSQRDRSAQRVL